MKRKIALFGIFIVIIFFISTLDIQEYLTLESIKANKEFLLTYVEGNYTYAMSIYMLVYILSVSFLIPIATPLTFVGGFLFGTFVGLLIVNIAATIGAIFAFLFSRYIVGSAVQKKYKRELVKFNHKLHKNRYGYLFSLRFLPLFPFFWVNFLCGLTKIDMRTFIITTSLGIIPGSIIYTFAGSQLAHITAIEDIFSSSVVFAFLLLTLFPLLPILYKRYKS